MTLIMALFDRYTDAEEAFIVLSRRGFKAQNGEIDVVSDQEVDETYTDLEQHPEVNTTGSVTSLGAPTPPQGHHSILMQGRFGDAYLHGGVDELRRALTSEGVADSTIRRIAETVERGGALLAVRTSQERVPEATDLLRRTRARVLA